MNLVITLFWWAADPLGYRLVVPQLLWQRYNEIPNEFNKLTSIFLCVCPVIDYAVYIVSGLVELSGSLLVWSVTGVSLSFILCVSHFAHLEKVP